MLQYLIIQGFPTIAAWTANRAGILKFASGGLGSRSALIFGTAEPCFINVRI